MSGADSASFLETRLARCRAIPELERPPEVAAFVLCADLQAQAAAALAGRPARSLQRRQQESLLFSLKLIASHCCRPTEAVLHYREEAQSAAVGQLHALLARGAGGNNFPLARQLGALLQQDRSLVTLLTVAAGLPLIANLSTSAELLPVVNGVVVRLQQPAEAARVRQELAAAQAQLPAPLLSFEQLLALFVGSAICQSDELLDNPNSLNPDFVQACSTATVLLPRLVPEHHPSQFVAAICASMAGGGMSPSRHCDLVRKVMEAAEQQSSDYTVALCGYQLPSGAFSAVHSEGAAVVQEVCTPSDVLGWVRQAREAQRRCETLLPQLWTCGLERRYKTAKKLKPWLRKLEQEGNRWQPMDAAAVQATLEAAQSSLKQVQNTEAAALECSSCSSYAPHLKRCAGCRLTQYCSSECQRAHWPQHRTACKAEQRRQQQRHE